MKKTIDRSLLHSFMQWCCALLVALAASLTHAATPMPPVFDAAKDRAGERYRYAVAQNTTFLPTGDGRSFVAMWLPPGTPNAGSVPLIVTLHGTGGTAFDEIALWHGEAKQRGIGIVALQWWMAPDDRAYLPVNQIYRYIDEVLRREQVRAGRVLFHGFSRGSAVSYAVAAFDGHTGNRYFGLIVANAGKAAADFPPNRDIAAGRFGSTPYTGSRWITVCGGRDPNPDRDGCPGMRDSAEWIRRYGGELLYAIEDPQGDHGVFHRTPAHVRRVLDDFLSASGKTR